MAGVAPNAPGCSTRLICPQANPLMKWSETSSCGVTKNLPCTFALNTAFRSLNLQSGAASGQSNPLALNFCHILRAVRQGCWNRREGVRFAAPVLQCLPRLHDSFRGFSSWALSIGSTSPYHSSTVSQNSFPRAHLR